ncbi:MULTISPECIES: flagellar basal body rod protein FlgG [Brevibacillus]|jgi:flagellar hook protein FlgE|uniref:Flagellar hook protein FlgE n=1 Tax=Brevibacillus borstelensis AK1 TaxID=1300222 RepID=M8EFF1_9BACL|nr:flagellar basal body rod protein FlgG [Brevibacillus borstelensis]EMT54185.1 flagellar hook protein FlgE [Brevibacillus borstelensis AK1]KKX54009.1 flagellar basal body rod protein FlgG [Brevibacillus borstelensis cifa_chp40]MBE5398034.1 flagellar basal body rod protein FlgG [Brevibacillus borstelensis]MCC0563451.1 flagellar basal body rod protein FlgG [Brevibacillus borstelensis]MCM3470058.1 flagellar basal body rod protein FlgG [Brevibacillus borstelensis]
MLRSMYSGISGLRGFQTKLDVIGNNIANVNTVGFKKGRVMFQDILSQNIAGATAPADQGGKGGTNPIQIGLGSQMASIDTVFSAGSPMQTNLPTDLSIEGDGFFMVTPDDGTTFYYTRAGNFTRDSQGYLVNSQGLKLVDSGGGTIQIPQDTYVSYSIGKDGVVTTVDAQGALDTPFTIGVMKFNNPGGLKKIGNSLYENTNNAGPFDGAPDTPITAAQAQVSIISGQLEMSNVDLSEEFTEMIVAQRGFQANSRIITTSDTVLEELVNLKR